MHTKLKPIIFILMELCSLLSGPIVLFISFYYLKCSMTVQRLFNYLNSYHSYQCGQIWRSFASLGTKFEIHWLIFEEIWQNIEYTFVKFIVMPSCKSSLICNHKIINKLSNLLVTLICTHTKADYLKRKVIICLHN